MELEVQEIDRCERKRVGPGWVAGPSDQDKGLTSVKKRKDRQSLRFHFKDSAKLMSRP